MKFLRPQSYTAHTFVFFSGDMPSAQPEQSETPDQASIDALVAEYKAKGWIDTDTSMVAIVGAAGSLKKNENGGWTVTNLDKRTFDAAVAAMHEADAGRNNLMAELSTPNPVSAVEQGSLAGLMQSVEAPLKTVDTENVVGQGSFAGLMRAGERIQTEAQDMPPVAAVSGDNVAKILKRAGFDNSSVENMTNKYDGDASKIWPGDEISVVDGQLKIDRA